MIDTTSMRERPDRFGTNPTIAGYEVIALDTGHPVGARTYATRQEANGAAFRLNKALMDGNLRSALGAVDGPPPPEYVGGRNFSHRSR